MNSALAFIASLSDEDRHELESPTLVPAFPEEVMLTIRDEFVGWARCVDRVEADASLEPDDPGAWFEGDWSHVLSTRSRLEYGLALLSPALAKRMGRVVAETDRRFLALTEVDVHGLVWVVDPPWEGGPTYPESEWWWRRIPRLGSMRKCLDEYLPTTPPNGDDPHQ